MPRRLLLLLAGLAASAATVALWSTTAHALGPVPVPPVSVPVSVPGTAPVSVPKVPPVRVTVPPPPTSVGGIVAPVVSPVAVVVRHLVPALPQRSTARPPSPRATASQTSPTSPVDQPRRAVAGEVATPRASRAMAGPSPAGRHPMPTRRSARAVFRDALDDLVAGAVGSAKLPVVPPFALSTIPFVIPNRWSRRVSPAAGPLPRPGFLVGTGSPG